MFQAAFELAGGAEDIDKAEAFAGYVVMACSILLGVRHEQASANILDIEWGIALWDFPVVKTFFRENPMMLSPMVIGRQYRLEIRVVDFDVTAAKICYVEIAHTIHIASCNALVDRVG